MSNLSKTLPRPAIAAVAWTDKYEGHQVRLYTQDMDGYIHESVKKGTQPWRFVERNIAKAKPNTSMAAFVHYDVGWVHIFYLDDNNVLQEICQDWNSPYDWSPGPLGKSGIKASSASRLAALPYNKNDYCTLFYQQTDGAIGQLDRVDKQGHEPVWTHKGTHGENPMNGTGLAAIYFKALISHGIRVYYQKSDGVVTDFAVDNSSTFHPDPLKITDAPPNVNLAAFETHHLDARFHVFWLDKFNFVSEKGWYLGKWNDPETRPGLFQAAPDSSIAAVFMPERDSFKQLAKFYVQDQTDQIVEFESDNLLTWQKAGVVPTTKA